jgi:hypothetical protein
MRIDGWRVVIYPNDHRPAHVHVRGPGWMVVVNLVDAQVRTIVGCDEHQARIVGRRIAEHRAALLEDWRRLHG